MNCELRTPKRRGKETSSNLLWNPFCYCARGILFVIARVESFLSLRAWNPFCPALGPLMLDSRVVFSFKQNFQHLSVHMIKCLLTELGWVGRERNKRKFQTFTCYKS